MHTAYKWFSGMYNLISLFSCISFIPKLVEMAPSWGLPRCTPAPRSAGLSASGGDTGEPRPHPSSPATEPGPGWLCKTSWRCPAAAREDGRRGTSTPHQIFPEHPRFAVLECKGKAGPAKLLGGACVRGGVGAEPACCQLGGKCGVLLLQNLFTQLCAYLFYLNVTRGGKRHRSLAGLCCDSHGLEQSRHKPLSLALLLEDTELCLQAAPRQLEPPRMLPVPVLSAPALRRDAPSQGFRGWGCGGAWSQ